MPEYPEIFVLRHGQTEWNRAGRHQGRLDSPLTELGQAQALEQSRILKQVLDGGDEVAAFCSPQGRAVETARIALTNVKLTPQYDDRLCEISFGKWQGLTFDEIALGWPELVKYADQNMFDWHFTAPGGESFDDLFGRAQEFLQSLSGPSIIVTHGITSRVLRGIWLGQGWDEMAAMSGGQGCVYHLFEGAQKRFTAG